MGGECNYFFQCKVENKKAFLKDVDYNEWQAEKLGGERPHFWPEEKIKKILEIAEAAIRKKNEELDLGAEVLPKKRAVGMYASNPTCARKLKQETLDEVVLTIKDALRNADPPITLPYCVFNGGRDVWVDIGNKGLAVSALSRYFGIPRSSCLHVGDQFLDIGNDIAARAVCPCIWVMNPHETTAILDRILKAD